MYINQKHILYVKTKHKLGITFDVGFDNIKTQSRLDENVIYLSHLL